MTGYWYMKVTAVAAVAGHVSTKDWDERIRTAEEHAQADNFRAR